MLARTFLSYSACRHAVQTISSSGEFAAARPASRRTHQSGDRHVVVEGISFRDGFDCDLEATSLRRAQVTDDGGDDIIDVAARFLAGTSFAIEPNDASLVDEAYVLFHSSFKYILHLYLHVIFPADCPHGTDFYVSVLEKCFHFPRTNTYRPILGCSRI